MKKRILLVAVLQLFLTLNSCSGGDDYVQPVEEIQGEIKADYMTYVSYPDDFIIDSNNNVFVTEEVTGESFSCRVKKIDSDGKATVIKSLDFVNFKSSILSTSQDGNILLVARFHSTDWDKIFRFENNFSDLNPFYSMKPVSSPSATKARLFSICNNNDNTYFVFDYNTKQMKRVVTELNTDVFVAGSGKKEIKDGTGLNAGFGTVNKIISKNNILYVVDNLYSASGSDLLSSNIRKLEYINNEWKVTTLISTTNSDAYYSDIAFDSKNELYVLVRGKGISKLNIEDNTLHSFREGEFKVGKGSVHSSLEYKNIEMMKIKENDMYLVVDNELIKISDFQSKFALAEK
nr:hypothetical protein [uncultured Flavobacterium sp.]